MFTFLIENLWEIFFGLLSAGALGFCKYLWNRTKKLEEMQKADQNRQTRFLMKLDLLQMRFHYFTHRLTILK